MPHLLTTNATITCPHGGQGKTVPSIPLLTINGGIALVEGDSGVITGCTVGCVSYILQSMGLNATKIGGKRAILTTDFNVSNILHPLTMIETHFGIDSSTPASLPPGQSAPNLPPAMQDTTPPTVALTPPTAAFTKSTSLPASVVLTGTLTATFPLTWRLTHLNMATKVGTDWTNGGPLGAVIAPNGSSGATITLPTSCLMALPVGAHRLVFFGASQRGLSASAQCDLTISA